MLQHNSDFIQRIRRVYSGDRVALANDADLALYDGFASEHDHNLFSVVRNSEPGELIDFIGEFQDARYIELLFRYRARNYPEALSEKEMYRWRMICRRQLTEKTVKENLTLDEYHQKTIQLRTIIQQKAKEPILNELEIWGSILARENGLSWPPDCSGSDDLI